MLAPGTVIAGYVIDGVIGHGATSSVYRARQVSVGREVALKVLTAAQPGSETEQRFRREARLQAALDHPSVLPVYDAGTANAGMFIAMKLVKGGSLRDVLRSGRCTAANALLLLGQVADALDFAHGRGLVHRDVKPQNVLVDGQRAYLADFGLTRELDGENMTRTGSFQGTVAYLAPELVAGGRGDGRCDLYSFAAMAFECLAGIPPFIRPVDAAVLYAHANETPPPISEVRADLPASLDRVFERGLAKAPNRRYETAAHLVAAIKGALGSAVGEIGPLPAPSGLPTRSADSTRSTVRPKSRRRPIHALGVGSIAIAIAAAGVLAMADDGREAANGAEAEQQAAPASGSIVLGSPLKEKPVRTVGCELTAPDAGESTCTLVQTALEDAKLRVPGNGVVRGWRAVGAHGDLSLQAVHEHPNGWTHSRRTSPVRIIEGTEGWIPANLGVEKGDRVGVIVGEGAGIGTAANESAVLRRWGGPLSFDQPPRAPSADPALDGVELLLQIAYVKGGRVRQPESTTGRIAARLDPGEPVRTLPVALGHRPHEIRAIGSTNPPRLELVRGSRRIATVEISGATPGGDLIFMASRKEADGLHLYLGWRDHASGVDIYNEFKVHPRRFELLAG